MVFIGPSLLFHSLEGAGDEDDNVQLGVYLGYTLNVIHKKNWFLGVKMNYQWSPTSEIGPLDVEGSPNFRQVKVRVANANLGVVVGIRVNGKA
ncbi:hypothetical protein V6R21_25150 [Limibacter armeniacum]|uniref:hypothetical protein n=1 Tax=Limibacter armeniacum TaxID=466084 RepID=UPI002FE5D7F0